VFRTIVTVIKDCYPNNQQVILNTFGVSRVPTYSAPLRKVLDLGTYHREVERWSLRTPGKSCTEPPVSVNPDHRLRCRVPTSQGWS